MLSCVLQSVVEGGMRVLKLDVLLVRGGVDRRQTREGKNEGNWSSGCFSFGRWCALCISGSNTNAMPSYFSLLGALVLLFVAFSLVVAPFHVCWFLNCACPYRTRPPCIEDGLERVISNCTLIPNRI